MITRQHHKGRKRLRGWHRGRRAGQEQAKALKALEGAERRALRMELELVELRADVRDDAEVWRAIAHAAPFVPCFAVVL